MATTTKKKRAQGRPPRKEPVKRLSVYMPERLAQVIESEAESEERSASAQVVKLLKAHYGL